MTVKTVHPASAAKEAEQARLAKLKDLQRRGYCIEDMSEVRGSGPWAGMFRFVNRFESGDFGNPHPTQTQAEDDLIESALDLEFLGILPAIREE